MSYFSRSPITQVIVEGNIGSGKTSFIEYFSRVHGSQVFPVLEPIHKWRDCRGVNLFNLLASDPKAFCFPFQQYVQLTMSQMHHLMPQQPSVKIMERSLYSARYCFAENLHASGLMNEAEFAVYQEWFDFLTGRTACDGQTVLSSSAMKENDDINKGSLVTPSVKARDHQLKHPSIRVDLIVYLKASPEVCLDRIHARKRAEEKKLPIDYLANLDRLHDKWLMSPEGDDKYVAPVLTIPANGSEAEMEEIFSEIVPFVMGERKLDKKVSGGDGLWTLDIHSDINVYS